ncbi:MAG: magnesium transporter CorA family protein, partial [Solirubrobacterales bacterium]|nr:magnesium transporter CorA family protein [Solirubrobacterales bacterium]
MASLPKPRLRRTHRGPAVVAPEPDRLHVEEIVHGDIRWINIVRPRATDRAWLEERYDFHPLAYEDVFSRNQRPKIDRYADHLFAILHFPRFDAAVGRLGSAELDVFVGPGYLITIPNEPIDAISYLFERCRQSEEFRSEFFSQDSGYLLYRITDTCVDAGFPMLRKIGAVRPQRVVFGDLEQMKATILGDDLDIYFEDLEDASERIWQILEGYKETIEALEATNESVISHQLNDVLRILTGLTVIFLPPTLVAGIMGMNTKIPGQGVIEGFWGAVAVVAVLLIGSLTY